MPCLDARLGRSHLMTVRVAQNQVIVDGKLVEAAELVVMSFFDRQGIPIWILKPSGIAKDTMRGKGPDEARDGESDDSGSTTDDYTNDDADDVRDGGFEDDVAMLRDYCLILVDETGNEFEMHGLVQLSMRRWLESDRLQDKFRQQFVKRLAAAFPTGDYSNWATCRQLFAHVEAAVDQRPPEESIEEWASLMYNGGWYAWSQGSYGAAERMVGKAQRSRKKRLGEDDEKTLDSMSLLALVFLHEGLWGKAEKLEVQVMETRKNKLGADQPDTLLSMHNLATTIWNKG